MDFQIKNPTAKWYIDLMERYKMLINKFGMPEDLASELKVFLLEVAREQYMAGNRSGIRWAREQTEAKAV
ncbi:MAG: hypothetical protein ABH846_04340 [Patescibacteria group bacterium]